VSAGEVGGGYLLVLGRCFSPRTLSHGIECASKTRGRGTHAQEMDQATVDR
jgi:hypothetical protein